MTDNDDEQNSSIRQAHDAYDKMLRQTFQRLDSLPHTNGLSVMGVSETSLVNKSKLPTDQYPPATEGDQRTKELLQRMAQAYSKKTGQSLFEITGLSNRQLVEIHSAQCRSNDETPKPAEPEL
tara:strand:- start:5339 stop:5707 length:369 start_codon:yes stop_codon:yes gene_type:complete